jgi:hypothetical protein
MNYIKTFTRSGYEDGPVPLNHSAGPRFPFNALKGHPRVIALGFHEDHDPSNITLADGIAIILYRWEQMSGMTGMLDKFF